MAEDPRFENFADAAPPITFRPPRPPWVITIIWGISPAAIIIAFVVIYGRDWPYLAWAAFIGGVVNMSIFSIWQLWSREVPKWEFKCIPLGLGMIGLNLLLVIFVSWILNLPMGAPGANP